MDWSLILIGCCILGLAGGWILGGYSKKDSIKTKHERRKEIYLTWKEVEDFIGDLYMNDACEDSIEDLLRTFREYCPRIVAKVEGKQ